MNYQKIKKDIAPCGLNCKTCFAHVNGQIREHSLKLKQLLGNFHIHAKRFETLLEDPIFQKYTDFKKVLDYLASENCKGCRNEECGMFKNCGVRGCHQKKKIDFCYQCDEFPCSKSNFDDGLVKVWKTINKNIREHGLENFYEKSKNRPRYG